VVVERKRSFASISILIFILGAAASHAQERDPIAFVGHSAFFDAGEKEVAPTPGFVTRAQTLYREKLLAALP
jgi:hypothetical protein